MNLSLLLMLAVSWEALCYFRLPSVSCHHRLITSLEVRKKTRSDHSNNRSLDDRLTRAESILAGLPEFLRNSSEETTKGIQSLTRAVQELTGYNQNQDKNLELECGKSLLSYIVSELGVKEEYVLEFEQRVLYNPETGDKAVEWDAFILIDYSSMDPDEIIPQHWPRHNTAYIMEVKQRCDLQDIFEKLPKRLNATLTAINSDYTPKSTKILARIGAQRAFFVKNLTLIVAIGGANITPTMQLDITSRGYLAMVPSGEAFTVVAPTSGRVH